VAFWFQVLPKNISCLKMRFGPLNFEMNSTFELNDFLTTFFALNFQTRATPIWARVSRDVLPFLALFWKVRQRVGARLGAAAPSRTETIAVERRWPAVWPKNPEKGEKSEKKEKKSKKTENTKIAEMRQNLNL
jgi:hypothetical protein